jgi:hypothetical protein
MRLVWFLTATQIAMAGIHPGERPVLHVVVHGESLVGAAEWTAARKSASRILERTGIEVTWQTGGEGSGASVGPSVRLYLLSFRPGGLHTDTGGFASRKEGYAAIVLPAIVRTADEFGVDRAVVMGATVAHEIGHLLLGDRHSQGVMSERFDWRQMRAANQGALAFSEGEARIIRRGIAALAALSKYLSEPFVLHSD